jgi:4-methylaminobutanoate oxidase (formaldehyde-forming)
VNAARAVVIGGGVAGCSIAYHLAQLGWSDVLVLERGELTGGSTFHAAGLVGQLRSSVALTRVNMASAELYARLGAETGRDPGWRAVGSLRLASSRERFLELKRQEGWARTFDLPLALIGPREARDLFPLIDLGGVEGALYLPTDGHIDPSGLALALAAGARARGAVVRTGVSVTGLAVAGGRVREVHTASEAIRCEVAVIAGGMWTPEIGRLAGLTIPIVPMAHQYLVTRPLPGTHRAMPTLRDPDRLVYFREEVGGLVVGGYERTPAPWGLGGIPRDFTHTLLAPDWPRFNDLMANAVSLIPALETAEVVRLINGPESFTPDGEFILGEAPQARGLFVAAGFCAHGIAGAGGVGKLMAEWIAGGEPPMDVWRMDLRRFGRHYADPGLTLARTREVYATYYDVHYPFEERRAGRPLRTSPAHPRLAALGAVFGEKAGWERPNWVGANAQGSPRFTPAGWFARDWSPAIEAEHLAARERAALFDETSFSKLEVSGPDALALLQRLTDNQMDRPPGTVTYTQMLNDRGGIEADLTVTRLARDRFLLVSGSAFGVRDLAWIRDHAGGAERVTLEDATERFACFGLFGPRARDILQRVTNADVGAAAFPYLTARAIPVAGAELLALRVTYVGELGWELYAPFEEGLAVWDRLWAAGADLGLVAGGYRAIDSLRLEKGYRYWSADVTPDDTPWEAGLGFCVKLDKGEFIGRGALVEQRARGVERRLVCLALPAGAAVPVGGEPIVDGPRSVGRVTSGGYGYAVGFPIAYGYVPEMRSAPETGLAVEIFGESVPAQVRQEPLYDPRHTKVKG